MWKRQARPSLEGDWSSRFPPFLPVNNLPLNFQIIARTNRVRIDDFAIFALCSPQDVGVCRQVKRMLLRFPVDKSYPLRNVATGTGSLLPYS